MKKLIVIGVILAIIAAAGAGLACSTFESPLDQPDTSQYSGEMYDDCREAFNMMSTSTLRRTLAKDGIDLSEMDDNDVRALIGVVCLSIASGDKDIDALLD